MAVNPFAFNPTDGLRDKTYIPTKPNSEDELRQAIQGMHDQTRNFINSLVSATNQNSADIADDKQNITNNANQIQQVSDNLDTHKNDLSIHVTTTDKNNWSAKANATTATTAANGLMSSSDKSKLDGIAAGAQVNDVTKAYVDSQDLTKQNKITISGIAKFNGSGSASAAIAGTDYATPAQVAAVLPATAGYNFNPLVVDPSGNVSWGSIINNMIIPHAKIADITHDMGAQFGFIDLDDTNGIFINKNSPDNSPLLVFQNQNAASSGDYIQCKDSTGNIFFNVKKNGNVYCSNINATNVIGNVAPSNIIQDTNNQLVTQANKDTWSAKQNKINVAGIAKFDGSGDASLWDNILNAPDGQVGLTVRGDSLESSYIQQWQRGSGPTVSYIDVYGNISAQGLKTDSGIGNSNSDKAYISLNDGIDISRNISDSKPILTVRQSNAASTGDFIQFRDSSNNILAFLDKTGYFQTQSIFGSTVIGTTLNGKNITLTGQDESTDYINVLDQITDANFRVDSSANIITTGNITGKIAPSNIVQDSNNLLVTQANKDAWSSTQSGLEDLCYAAQTYAQQVIPISTRALALTKLNLVMQGQLLKNELNYTPSTWVEWTKSSGVVGDGTGLEFTANGSTIVNANLLADFKPNTKYLILYDILNNTVSGTVYFGTASDYFNTGFSKNIGNNKLILTTASSATYNRIYIGVNAAETSGNKIKFNQLRIYEVPIGSQIETDSNTMTTDQLALKYPYIQGGTVKSTGSKQLTVTGANIFNKDATYAYSGITIATITNGYNIKNTSNSYSRMYWSLNLSPNTTYAISRTISIVTGGTDSNNGTLRIMDGNSINEIIRISKTDSNSTIKTFTTPSDGKITLYLYATMSATEATEFNFTNIMLSSNLTATYEPYISTTYTTPTIGNGLPNGIGDILDLSKGIKTQNCSDWLNLDGSLSWTYGGTVAGLKSVSLPAQLNQTNIDDFRHMIINYKNVILTNINADSSAAFASGDQTFQASTDSGSYRLSVNNSDSGFVDSYTPTSSEIKAYFYGWKMCMSDGSTWDGTSTKYWKKLTDGTGITSTLPTASYAGYTPYKIFYQLATPIVTAITGIPIFLARPNGQLTITDLDSNACVPITTVSTATTDAKASSISNVNSPNNAKIDLNDNGVNINRNIADNKAIATIRNLNTSSTGDLLDLCQSDGTIAAKVDVVGNGTFTSLTGTYFFGIPVFPTATFIPANSADVNPYRNHSIIFDSNYMYVAVDSLTWKRVALSTF